MSELAPAQVPAGGPHREPQDTSWWKQAWFWPTLVAALIRVPLACFADDQWGDAPIRLDMLQRWITTPGLWWSFRRTYQYGPFPTHFAGLLGLCGLSASAASRVLVCSAGVVGCALVANLAQRAGGRRSGLAAGLALALSPLHIQASTTYASEAIYLAFALGCLEAVWSRQPWLLVICAFCASTTRYDAWLWLPLLAFWWIRRGEVANRSRDWAVASLLVLGPLSILLANAIDLGDPLAPIHYIDQDHAALVAGAQAHYGVLPWRLAMVGYYPTAVISILTPAFGLAMVVGVVHAVRRRSAALMPITIGGLVPILYAFRTVALGSLWPMARFVAGPVAMLSIGMPALRKSTLALCVTCAVASDVGLAVLGDGSPGVGLTAAAMSPLSRLPADLRAGGEALRAVPGPVALDEVPTYEDVLVAYESGMNRYRLLHPEVGTVPRRIVAILGGAWDAQLRKTAHAFGHLYRQSGSEGRVSWWDLAE